MTQLVSGSPQALSRYTLALRMGDNALVLAQRLSEWCGKGPVFEEDMALTNVALDLIGQARMWLSLAGQTEGEGRCEDQLAYLRDAKDFTNLLLVEQVNGDYAQTMVRQFLFDAWHRLALRALVQSADAEVAAIAAKALKEVEYHLRRSSDLVIRLGDGTAESHRRMQAALDLLWPFTGELFDTDEADQQGAGLGIGFKPEDLRSEWLTLVADVLQRASLKMPGELGHQRGGKQGRHSEKLGFLLAEMQFLQRAYPGATW